MQLVLDAHHVERILSYCEAAGQSETGGMLVGRYNQRHDTALVLDVLGPPEDSLRGRSWFQRGTLGVQQLLQRMWKSRNEHYLGEWHFHPYASPTPSNVDYEQMLAIATSASWKCPEPVLLIIGGDPLGRWRPYGLVTTRKNQRIRLDPFGQA